MDSLNTPAGEAFDRLTRIAARTLDAPISLVTQVDEGRQRFAGQHGLPEPWATLRETPISHSFCRHAVAAGAPLVIVDAREHPLVRDNPAIEELGVVAYAGHPLRAGDGRVLGVLCAIDHAPRSWTRGELETLADLADTAAAEMQWRAELEAAAGRTPLGAGGGVQPRGEHFRLLVESVKDYGIFMLDPEGRIASWNVGAERIKGYSREEVLGKHFSLFYTPEDLARNYPEHELKVAAREGRFEDEGWRVRRDGSRFWANVVITSLRSPDGELVGFAKVTRDLTERRRTEEELRRREERFHSLVTATTQIVWVTDPAGMLLPDLTTWGDFTGQRTEEYLGWGWLAAIHPDDRDRTAAAWSGAVESRALFQLEHRVRRHDGEYRRFSVRAVPVLEPDGSIREWVGTHTDVTEQRRVEEEREFLAEASQVLASSLDYDTTLTAIAHLAVARIADWCGVDLLDGDKVRRVAIAHADPAKAPIADQLRRYPFNPDAPGGSPLAIRTGQPALYPEIPDALLEAVAQDAEHQRVLRTLGMRSAIVVPLIARGQTLGAISLVASDSGRRYGPREMELAQELATRAATAVDHARLFRQSEETRVAVEHQAMELELQMEELQNQATQLEENQVELEMANEALQRSNAELSAAEAHYHRLVQSSPNGVYVLDAQGGFREMNPAGERILGCSSDEMLGRHFEVLLAPESVQPASDAFTRIISGAEKRLEIELWIRRPSGERRLVNAVITGIPGSEGIVGIHGVFRDITDERETQAALQESETSYRQLFDSLTELVFILDLDGRVLNVNEAVVRRYGYHREELVGLSSASLVDQEARDSAAVVENHFRRAREGEPQRFLLWGRTRSGESFPKEMTLTRGRYFGQDVVIAVGRDITERKQAEARQRESEAREQLLHAMQLERSRLSALFEQAPAFIILLQGPEHVVQLSNVHFERLVGDRELVGRPLRDAVPEMEEQGYLAMLDRAYRTGEPAVGKGSRLLIQREPGAGPEEHYVNFVCQPLVDPEGRVTEIFVHGIDVSDLVRARQEAEVASRAKSDFLSRMSHELRTPLNAILGFGQLLEMDARTDEDRESVEQILRAGKLLLALIDEVLDLSKIEAGQLSLSVEPVPVHRVLQESLDLVRLTAAKQGIALQAHEALATRWHVLADQQRLKQVLLNLLSNAIKYNRREGTVRLGCEHVAGDRLRIWVQDTGYGIPADKLERLFTPFERLDAGHSSVEGTGLGLALSKGLVEAMGGRLGVASVEGEGSRFWLELAVTPAPEPTATVPEGGAEDTTDRVATATHTVLVVEDNLANVRVLERVFQRRSQVRLLTAMQGRLGLQLAREHRPDLILLDLNLPDLSGDGVLLQLRQDPELRDVPVVMISGDAIPSQVQRLLDLGARSYITKPFDIQELLRVVDESLAREQGSPE